MTDHRARLRLSRPAALGLLAGLVVACGGGGESSSSTAANSSTESGSTSTQCPTDLGTLLADSCFRPASDGFNFPNYGNEKNYTNLTAAELQSLYGDAVCVAPGSGKCDLIPTAQAFLDAENMGMSGGHCQGFAATAMLFFRGYIKPSDFGADKTVALPIDGNDRLQRRIALSFEYQTLDSVFSQLVQGTPNDIVTKLTDYFKNPNGEAYVLSIRKRDNTGGHAITPFALKDAGGGKVQILVYDNNYPNEVRTVDVDTAANTWSYNAAINPSVPPELYEGDAQTMTMRLRPTKPALSTQPCPFCATVQKMRAVSGPAADAATAGGNDEIFLEGSDTNHAHLLISDDAGHQLGYAGGKLVSEFPGAHAVDQDLEAADFNEELEPDYEVPADSKLSITVDGSGLSAPDTEYLLLTGPTRDLELQQLTIAPGQKDTITIPADRSSISLKAGGTESPQFHLGDDGSGSDYAFDVVANGMAGGSSVTMSLQDTDFVIDTTAAGGAGSYDVAFTKLAPSGDVTFKHSRTAIPSGTTARLMYTDFSAHGQAVKLVTDSGSQDLSDEG